MMRLIRYRKPSIYTILGVTKVMHKIKKQQA